MGFPRRFLNLIVDNGIQGGKSLNRIDLMRHKLFKTRTPAVPPPPKGNRNGSESERPPQADDRKNHNHKQAASSSSIRRKIREIQLDQPTMNLRSSMVDFYWHMKCFPLAGRKVLCVDAHCSRTVLFDVNSRLVQIIPGFHAGKMSPLACFVPVLPSTSSAGGAADATDVDDDDGNGSFYILEGSTYHEKERLQEAGGEQLSNQFEAFVYHSESKSWRRQLLPPPPIVLDPKNYEEHSRPRRIDITSYAVVERGGGGGSHGIVVSADNGAGTYCLDTVTHTWSKVGDWVLPFTGKVEYVPELKLWFGICSEDLQLGAADLSSIMESKSQPQLVGTWKELQKPAGWNELMYKPPQLVSLGSGRFCITRFLFRALPPDPLVLLLNGANYYGYSSDDYDPVDEEFFTVLTGVDVVPCVHDAYEASSTDDTFSGGNGNGSKGKVELQMIKHNSRRHMSNGSDGNIEIVF